MKKRRLSTILMCCLLAVFCGLGGYVVYALSSEEIEMKATNDIIFNADKSKIFYIATVNVKYQGGTKSLATDTIDHSGTFGKQNLDKNSMSFGNAIKFTSENMVIVYEIEIENRTGQQIKVVINKPANNEHITNEIDVSEFFLNAYDGEKPTQADKKTVTITTTMKSNQFSFKSDNSFSIDITSNLQQQ